MIKELPKFVKTKPEITRLFAEANYRINHPDITSFVNGNISNVEKESMNGAKFFKRKTLGIFVEEKEIDLEELTQAVYHSNLADSLSESKALIPNLLDIDIKYNQSYLFGIEYLFIAKIGRNDYPIYRITTWKFN